MDTRRKKADVKLDKSPYNRRTQKIDDKAFKSVEKSVRPVAKDTNKTRRKNTRERKIEPTVPNVKPRSDLKKVMKKLISTGPL